MDFMNITSQKDLNLLKTFSALWQYRNVTEASKKLNLSQSAVSNSLNRLRNELNDPLFVRIPKGVTPTPKATEIAAKIEFILQEIGSVYRFD